MIFAFVLLCWCSLQCAIPCARRTDARVFMSVSQPNPGNDKGRAALVTAVEDATATPQFKTGSTVRRIAGVYAFLAALNVGAWLWALIAFHRYPVLLGTAFLAYSFGLRHAVDADHIAAIDNVTRKLMQQGQRPAGVGLMFSLGHSTVVIVGSIAIAVAALKLQSLALVKSVGAVAGTLVSSFFLLAIAAVNIVILRSVFRTFQSVRRGEPYVEEDLNLLLASRGFLSRIFRRIFSLVNKSWHMYPLGLLFGLGFDTATEIGLLGISAAEASRGLPILSILVFPALFAAGMSLIDTTDNVLMLGAYGWAYVKPIRKLYYNMTITFVSVVVALIVGGVEALGLIGGQAGMQGSFWDFVARLNDNFGMLGYCIIAIFALSWIASIAFYRLQGLDEIEVRAEVEGASQQ
jgi:nickel/cobalt transporter (NiCoT) family protein